MFIFENYSNELTIDFDSLFSFIDPRIVDSIREFFFIFRDFLKLNRVDLFEGALEKIGITLS